MFLGSNSVRHLNAAVFSNWPYLAYLTLENIIVDDVAACLELIGKQLKGLKIQCGGFDIMDVAVNCPNLVSLIIQKECPFLNISTKARHERLTNKILFPSLKHLEITCSFPKSCFGLIISHAPFLKSIKIFEMPGLRRENFEEWCCHLQKLETLIIFRAPEMNKEAVEVILDSCPNLRRKFLLNRFLRERGMASNPKMEYQVFLCIFQKNSAMATLGLKEMGKFLWEGREKGLPCWPSQFSFLQT